MAIFDAKKFHVYPEFRPAYKDLHHRIAVGDYEVSIIEARTSDAAWDHGGYRYEAAILDKQGALINMPARFGGGTTYRTQDEHELNSILRMLDKRAHAERMKA